MAKTAALRFAAAQTLVDVLAHVMPMALKPSGSRPILESVCFQYTPKRGTRDARLRVVASDNYRIGWQSINPEAFEADRGLPDSIVINAVDLERAIKVIKPLAREGRSLDLRIGDGTWAIECGGTTLSGPLVEGQYPNVTRFIDESPPRRSIQLAVDAELLASAAKAICDKERNAWKGASTATLIITLDPKDLLAPLRLGSHGRDDLGVTLMPVRIARD